MNNAKPAFHPPESLTIRYILLFIYCFIGTQTFAQNNPYSEMSIASPTAASLGKVADIPVNYHTGIPQINIPIYTIKEGPLKLPVNLSYHASGLKVMEPASWVGAGWSLEAGGVITRTVRGLPDERGTTPQGHTHGHFSDYGYSNYYMFPDNNSLPCANGYNSDAAHFVSNQRDGEPDLFFFNFAGYSGKFYFRDDRTPVIVPEQDIKIEYDHSGSGSIAAFILTVPDGTKYYFGKTSSTTDVDPVEITNPYTDQSGQTWEQAYSSWYLNKIVSADELFSISLEYEKENYGYYTISMFPLLNTSTEKEFRLLKNVLYGVRLSKITFSNGTVTFVPGALRTDLNGPGGELSNLPNTESKSLAGIEIAGTDGFCKQYNFSYSYFEDNNNGLPYDLNLSYSSINTDRRRLRLDRIQEQTCNGSLTIPPHIFEYYSELVPRRLSFAQDHWGFYNGVNSNQKLIPAYTTDRFNKVSGADRDPKWPEMRGGTLKRIIYPTGGFAEFEFEPHTTWINTTKYTEVGVTGATTGYDGNQAPYNWTAVLTGNYHRFTVSSASGGGNAAFVIRNTSTGAVRNIGAEPGKSYSEVMNLGAGNYSFTLSKSNASTGNGAQAGVLEQIGYPYSKNDTVGGLRVKKITRNSGVTGAPDIETQYSYDANGTSSGILYSRPTYVQIYRNEGYRIHGYVTGTKCSENGCVACDGSTTLPYFKSPVTGRPMETTQGNHIGYNEVNVTQPGNGHSVYRYYGSNRWDNIHDDVAYRNVNPGTCDINIPSFPAAPLPHEFMRGELKYEGHFNEGGQVLKDVWYYPVFQENPVTTPGMIIQSAGGNGSYVTYYELKTGKKTQQKSISTSYTPGQQAVSQYSEEFFESPYHLQPTRKRTVDALGDTLETKIKYASDFRIASCDAISDCYNDYTAAIASYTAQYNAAMAACTTFCCRFGAWNKLIYQKGEARKTYVNCRRNNFTNHSNAYNTCMVNAKNGAGADLKPILELRNVYQNPSIEITEWKAGKLLNAAFTNYAYASSPATKVYPAKVQKINLTTAAATFTASSNTATAVTKDSRYEDESTAKHISGNLVELKSKAGIPIAYLWGHSNTLPIVKAIGVDYTTLKAAYDAVSGNLSQLRNQASLANAQVSTFTYKPTIGMTSLTDVNGFTNSFEYDDLGRLKIEKDKDGRILRQYDYQYQAPAHGNAIWTATGTTRCKPCLQNEGYITNIQQREEKDTNPQSGNYAQTRWVDIGASSSCVIIADWQNTGGAQCLTDANGYRTGIQRTPQKDMNPCSPTYNQTRNSDVTNTTACPPNAPNWQNTGVTRCKPCAASGAYITNTIQQEQRDNNPNSSNYNQLRWVDAGTSSSCVINPDWQNTTTPLRCKTNPSNQNTGEQEQEQKDMNPCSGTFNQVRWVITGTNTTACPLPLIYPKLVLENHNYQPGITTADIIIYFYSDDARTIPVSVNNLQVNYKAEGIVNGHNQGYAIYSVQCTGSRIVVRTNATIYYYDYWNDPSTEEITNYYLYPGTGYVFP